MTEESLLSDEFVRQLTAVGGVDILVGVPTLNNRTTVERVIDAILIGLVKYYPGERSVLINPDGGSKDGTSQKGGPAAYSCSGGPTSTPTPSATANGGAQGRAQGARIGPTVGASASTGAHCARARAGGAEETR